MALGSQGPATGRNHWPTTSTQRMLFFLQSAIKCWQTLPEPTVLRAFRDTGVLQPPHFDVKKAGESLASPTCGCAIAWRDNHPGQSGFPGQIQMEAAQSLNEKLEIFFWGCLSRKRSKESYSLKNVMFLSQLYIFQLRSQQF